jgi:hypothetical protein
VCNTKNIRVQDRNGVKVRVHLHDNGTTVDADCQCFGSSQRLHTNPFCPVLVKATEYRRDNGVST